MTAKDADTLADSLEYVEERGNPSDDSWSRFRKELEKKIKRELEELGIRSAKAYSSLGDYQITNKEDYPTSVGGMAEWTVKLGDQLVGHYSSVYDAMDGSYDSYEFDLSEEYAEMQYKVRDNPSDCPPATQSLELNTKNRNNAIQSDYIRYGPLNLNDLRYYDDAAAHWKTDVATAKKSKCSNCVAFDISPRMLDCMPGPVSEPIEDEEGYLGYCWMHHFKCHSARTCYTWARWTNQERQSIHGVARQSLQQKEPSRCPPIFTGEPTSKFSNKGMISAEVQIGRNVVKDVGEVVSQFTEDSLAEEPLWQKEEWLWL